MFNFGFSRDTVSHVRRTTARAWSVAKDGAQGDEAPFQRIYAIADVHGHFGLFREALRAIQTDNRKRGPAQTVIVIAGDSIDRGPRSRQMLQLLQTIQSTSSGVIVLAGNHEQMLIDSADGDGRAQDLWMRSGGSRTLDSYKIDVRELRKLDTKERAHVIRQAIGNHTLQWLRSLPASYRSGGYFFCHAGIRPGTPLGQQLREDLLWIRKKFHQEESDHGAVIVHGHCEEPAVRFRHNRIGIDLGAHRTGRLAILGLEGTDRWTMNVRENAADISDTVLRPTLLRS